jgi:tRNA threonylcarbamoyladenosine biosynthesis protein TsaE
MRISSVAEMESAGETFAQQLQAGDVISLQGELGAGKTAFTRGVGRGLGVSDQISSPTFVIARLHHGRCTFTHVDLYRLLDHDNVVDEVIDLDFDTSGIVIIEWGDPQILSKCHLQITAQVLIEIIDDDQRELLITWQRT